MRLNYLRNCLLYFSASVNIQLSDVNFMINDDERAVRTAELSKVVKEAVFCNRSKCKRTTAFGESKEVVRLI